jgi:hypothetical protein
MPAWAPSQPPGRPARPREFVVFPSLNYAEQTASAFVSPG